MQEEHSHSLNKSKKEEHSNHCYEKDLSNPIRILCPEIYLNGQAAIDQ